MARSIRAADPGRVSLFSRARERPVILIHQVSESARHLVGGIQRRLITLRVFDLPPQRELEPLQSFGDLRLQPLELSRILVDAVVVELAHCAQNLIEVSGVRAVIAKLLAETLGFAGPVARLISEVSYLARRKDALTPSAPVVAVGRGAAIRTAGTVVAAAPVLSALAFLPLT